ncbi:unnamed protein product, partial [Didymodactylos carnosus]
MFVSVLQADQAAQNE